MARLFDADADAEVPWLAVEFVDGPNLVERISSSGPLAGDDLSAFAVAVLDGLGQLHAVGVAHRDLKPANVLMSPDGPVLVDFGIAAAVDATAMTRTGTTLGSAGWMAPEQVRGAGASFPADVWAWGALVAYASAGQSPFGGGPADAIIYRSLREEPDLASPAAAQRTTGAELCGRERSSSWWPSPQVSSWRPLEEVGLT